MAIQNNLNIIQTGILAADGNGDFDGRTLTAGTGISIANGDGIGGNPTISGTATVPISFPTGSGTAIPAANALTFADGTGINMSGAGSTVTVNIDVPVLLSSGGTGSTSFTAGSIPFSNGTILTQDNANLFYDDTNNRLGIGTATPLDTFHVVGAMELDHTAIENDDYSLEIVCDAAGFSDVKAIDIDYITGAVGAGSNEEAILVNIDETLATGGKIVGYQIVSTLEGSAEVIALKCGPGIDAIRQEVGSFGNMDSALNKAVDVLAALSSGGAGNISAFVADDDTFTIGDAASFGALEIILDTGASGSGISPTFEYSTAIGTWASFGPVDGTNGFKNTGVIEWDVTDLAGFATGAGTEFLIRITRTRNTLSTTPIIDEVQIAALTEFKWDANADVNLNSLTLVTDLAVSHGGTGASTLGDGFVLLGSGTGAITALDVTSKGSLLVGDGTTDPVALAVGTNDYVLTADSAEASGMKWAASTGASGIVTADSDSGTATGSTVKWQGGEGIDTSATGAIVTITAETATSSNLGVATFDENDFLVTSGDVTMADRTRLRPEYVENIGISYNGGTGVFTVQGAQASLSSTNPGYICLQSKSTPGELTLYKVTADQSFIDDNGASEIIGNRFGLTTGIAHPAQMPFFIYAVGDNTETNIAFMITRVPHARTSPTSAAIGDPALAVADTQGSFFSLENITQADYESNPCLCIGSLAMVFSASDDWTIQTLTLEDGIGNFYDGKLFALSDGQFGASAGTSILPNGGTAPNFGGSVYYNIRRDGLVTVNYVETAGTGSGAGAVTTFGIIPYTMVVQYTTSYQGSGFVQTSSATVDVNCQIQSGVNYQAFGYNSTLTTSAFILNSNFGVGSRIIRTQTIYTALPTE